jgi:hypothetical protein
MLDPQWFMRGSLVRRISSRATSAVLKWPLRAEAVSVAPIGGPHHSCRSPETALDANTIDCTATRGVSMCPRTRRLEVRSTRETHIGQTTSSGIVKGVCGVGLRSEPIFNRQHFSLSDFSTRSGARRKQSTPQTVFTRTRPTRGTSSPAERGIMTSAQISRS